MQFTRQTDGIAGALKKIAILAEGSKLQRGEQAEEVAHMLFGDGVGKFGAVRHASAAAAAHPCAGARLSRRRSGAAGGVACSAQPDAVRSPRWPADRSSRWVVPGGRCRLRCLPCWPAQSWPETWRQPPGSSGPQPCIRRCRPALTAAVRQPESALAVVLALATSVEAELQPAQRRIVADAFGDDVLQAVQTMLGELTTLPPIARLPLAALAFPALKQLPEGRQQTLLDTLDALVRADGKVDLNEYCLARLLRMQLQEARQPRRAPIDGLKKLPACRDSVSLVCAIVAAGGCSDEASARRAWLLAMQHAFPGEAIEWSPPPAAWQAPLERALDDLDGLMPMAKELLIQSLLSAIHADGQISVEEAELLRVICASLHCPVPV